MSGDTAADVADAEASIRTFDNGVSSLADTEALARLLLRAEAVASSHIEGLVIGGRRLLRAEAASALGQVERSYTLSSDAADSRLKQCLPSASSWPHERTITSLGSPRTATSARLAGQRPYKG
ncbi:MAG: Fic/DOC family N-terminal domain-containing protein [Acidimicrobiales bacterium]